MFLEIAIALPRQDIGWQGSGSGNLTARIEGENNGTPFSEDYAYRRIAGAMARCGAR